MSFVFKNSEGKPLDGGYACNSVDYCRWDSDPQATGGLPKGMQTAQVHGKKRHGGDRWQSESGRGGLLKNPMKH